jgi:nitrite reductase/ring-hydroxylating ferredoxin subunit
MKGRPENRLERIVTELLRGRRLKLRGGDAEEKAAITAAARLAGTSQGPQRMHPAFRRRLAQALEQQPRDGLVTRRMALVAGLGLAAGAAMGGLVGRATEPKPPVAGGEAITPVSGRWVDVAALSDLQEGNGKQVVAGSIGAFVFRHGDSVTAVSSICSHLPCELWWDGHKGNLACPCHPAAFLPDGRPVDAYSLPALNTVHVRVTSEGRVEVLGTE